MEKIIQLREKGIESSQTSSYCSFCDAEDGKLRLVGRYIVSLKEIELHGEKKKACQGCYQSVRNQVYKQSIKEKKMNTNWLNKWKLKGFLFLVVFAVVFITSSEIIAQPMLPSAPDQAPIDGGIGLLAAAGGAYAIIKLKGRKVKMN